MRLRNYLKTYRPDRWLFPGSGPDRHLSAWTAENILNKRGKKPESRKHATVHTLRYSFRTHLLEDGTDLRYVQELPGHSCPETTMIYIYVTEKDLKKIRSLLDNFIIGKK